MNDIVTPDLWLGAVMGRPVWRITGRGLPPDLLQLADGGDAFFYAKIPTTDVSQVAAFTAAGFRVVDVNLTFDRPATALGSASPSNVCVVPCPPHHQAGVMEIAARCFVYSRFHLDPHVPPDLANEIKRAWVENYCRGARGDCLFVALCDDQPAGFLAALATRAHVTEYRIIDLIGVAPSFQGRGIGITLVATFINHYAGKCDQLRVGTQAANIASVRLYERMGFRLAESNYVLHAHVRGGQLLS